MQSKSRKAVSHLGEVWNELLSSRSSILEDWPDDLFDRPRGDILRSRIDREMAWALWGGGKPGAMRKCSIPSPSPEGLGITGIEPKGIAGQIEIEHIGLVAELRAVPLPEQKPETEAA